MIDWVKGLIKGTALEPAARRLYRIAGFNYIFDKGYEYDRQLINMMRSCLHEDSNCVDVGAHQGLILEEMMKLAPRGRHFAFEPIPHLARALRERYPTAHVFEYALSDSAGEATFQYVANDPAYSGLRRRIYDRKNPEIEEIRVRCETLDNVISEDVDVKLIKIDVEGAEYQVLRGAAATISRCRPIVAFEAMPNSTNCYGVTSGDLYSLLTSEYGMKVSTLQRLSEGRNPLTDREFRRRFDTVRDFFFLAYF